MQRTILDYGTDMVQVQETSKQAYDELKVSGKLKTLQQEYMDNLWAKEEPCTDNEINFAAGYYPDDKFAPRRRELENAGLLIRCNRRICKVTGNLAFTFWFTSEGLMFVGKEG